jgi:hypothetical protein
MAVQISQNTVPNTLTLDQLKSMIAQLAMTQDGEPLKTAMTELKEALRANPDACALMLPEDIGQAVHYLRKMTGQLISAEANKEKSTKKKKILSPEEEKALEDNLFDGL